MVVCKLYPLFDNGKIAETTAVKHGLAVHVALSVDAF